MPDNIFLTGICNSFHSDTTLLDLVVSRGGLKLNGTHQLLAYTDDVNILRGSIHTVKENAEALVFVTKKIGLEVNADKN